MTTDQKWCNSQTQVTVHNRERELGNTWVPRPQSPDLVVCDYRWATQSAPR